MLDSQFSEKSASPAGVLIPKGPPVVLPHSRLHASKNAIDDLRSLALSEILSNPQEYLVHGRLHRYVLFVPSDDGSAGWYIKFYRPLRPWRKVVFSIFPSHAWREYHFARLLHVLRVPGILPSAWARLPGKRSASILITKQLVEAAPLSALIADGSTDPKRRERLLREYGKILGRLNRFGCYYPDFHMENVLITREDRVVPIDYESLRLCAGWFRRWRYKNLVTALFSEQCAGVSDWERDWVYESYLTGLRNKIPSREEVVRLSTQVRCRKDFLSVCRNRKRARKPFRGIERLGNLRFRRRREVDGSVLLKAWEDARCLTGHPQQGDVPLQITLRVHELLLRCTLYGRRGLLSICMSFLGCGKGMRKFRSLSRYSERLLGFVEQRPFGPFALFEIESGSEIPDRAGDDGRGA